MSRRGKQGSCMIFRTLGSIKEAVRRPSYRRYLWARLYRQLANVDTETLRLYLPSDKLSAEPDPSQASHDRALPKVREMLFTMSPYAEFSAEGEPYDLQGWGSDD